MGTMISLLAEKMITEIPILVTQMRRRKKEVRKSFVRRDFFDYCQASTIGKPLEILSKMLTAQASPGPGLRVLRENFIGCRK